MYWLTIIIIFFFFFFFFFFSLKLPNMFSVKISISLLFAKFHSFLFSELNNNIWARAKHWYVIFQLQLSDLEDQESNTSQNAISNRVSVKAKRKLSQEDLVHVCNWEELLFCCHWPRRKENLPYYLINHKYWDTLINPFTPSSCGFSITGFGHIQCCKLACQSKLKNRLTNSVGPVETASNNPSHLGLFVKMYLLVYKAESPHFLFLCFVFKYLL